VSERVASGGAPAITVEHASRWYGNLVAVNDISFDVGPGVTGLLGPNGAGKTTLLHMAAGLLAPSAGSVRIMGRPAWHDPGIYRQVGLVPEREAIHRYLTGRELVLACAVMHGLADPDGATRQAIDRVELAEAADRRIGTYSKGMRQRIKVAAALVHDPPVLILDEPFNGMDPRQRLHMFELLGAMASEGRTILLSSHVLEEVERVAQSVLVIYAGRLAASGDFRSIRRLMTDRPHVFLVRSSDDRRLGAALIAEASVFGVELEGKGLLVRTSDVGRFTRRMPVLARSAGISLLELRPTDESLESVFAYLVGR
jgi:ABC-2 type transport system ATP-binding protein